MSVYEVYVRWTPQPVIVTIMDNKDYIRVLLYSIIPLLQGGGVLLKYMGGCQNYDPFWGTLNSRCRIMTGSKRDPTFDNHPIYARCVEMSNVPLRFRV